MQKQFYELKGLQFLKRKPIAQHLSWQFKLESFCAEKEWRYGHFGQTFKIT